MFAILAATFLPIGLVLLLAAAGVPILGASATSNGSVLLPEENCA
jgi:hypothetical protein